jgi:predicted dehydrogenase
MDAVFIPLPIHQRVDWAIHAMRAGKHVLCEVPAGLDTEDVNRLIDATSRYPDVKVMEALAYRLHPQWQDTKRRVDSGEIGRLVTVQSFYSRPDHGPEGGNDFPDTEDGGLVEMGSHCVSVSRFLLGIEPVRVCGFADHGREPGAGRLFAGMIDFSGPVAIFTCATTPAAFQRVNIVGTTGSIEVLTPFAPPGDAPTQTVLQPDRDPENPIRTITFGVCDQHAALADAFARAILDDTPPPVSLTDAWANIHVIEVLRESARLGAWVAC